MSKLDLFFKIQDNLSRFFQKTYLIMGLLCITNKSSFCQAVISYDQAVITGNVVKHTSKLTIEPKSPSIGTEFSYRLQTRGTLPWQVRYRYPQFGVTLSAISLGNKQQLGYSIGIFPNILFPVFTKKLWGLDAQVGSGVTYITTPYNRLKNPLNNANGSHWNNLSAFRVGGYYRLTPHWTILTGLAFHHASNGRYQMPNYGINVLSMYSGVRYTPKPLERKDFLKTPDTTRSKPVAFFQYAQATNEDNRIIGGAKYPIYVISTGLGWQFNSANRIWLGYEYEQNKGIYDFAIHTFTTTSHQEATKLASRNIVFLADELTFSSVSIWLQTGFYIGQYQLLVPEKYFFKLSTRYYLPTFKNFPRLYGAVALKTHLFDAEYISWGMGMVW